MKSIVQILLDESRGSDGAGEDDQNESKALSARHICTYRSKSTEDAAGGGALMVLSSSIVGRRQPPGEPTCLFSASHTVRAAAQGTR